MGTRRTGQLRAWKLLPWVMLLLPATMGARGCEKIEVDVACADGACDGAVTSKDTCRYDGEEYEVGDGFPAEDGCNQCSCTKGGEVACTLIGCAGPTVCEYNGEEYRAGEGFPSDDGCNSCSCQEDGTVVCTLRLCTDPMSCIYEGEEYKIGETFPAGDGCNTCFCAEDGSAQCTLALCAVECGGLQGLSCAEGEYCNFPPDAQCGAADQTGFCAVKPEACTREFNPVCGCDDSTYGNACTAAAAGVAIAYSGECNGSGPTEPEPEPGECGAICGTRGAAPCGEGTFCDFPEGAFCGAADAPGECTALPEVCADIFAPVCGCDGETYGNACEANANGVSVASEGECGGSSGETCEYNGTTYEVGDSFPDADGCNECGCNEGGIVACTLRLCVDICGGLTGIPCADGEFCNFPIEAQCGAADGTGICEATGGACTREYQPVCGCDGATYGNACTAAAAGVSIVAEGECEGEGGTCEYNGQTFEVGDSFPSDDGCNTCSCSEDGLVACTERACLTCGGLLGASCPDDQFCNFPIEAQCGAADQTGVCTALPEACTLELNPVCGCDGETYSNACAAASEGVSVVSEGECE